MKLEPLEGQLSLEIKNWGETACLAPYKGKNNTSFCILFDSFIKKW